MKQIVAVVKPYKIDDIRDAMEGVGVDSFTYGEVRGIGHHKGERDIYRGLEYAPSYVPMMEVIVVVNDDIVDQVVAAIAGAAKTDEPGDGKIMVSDLAGITDISSGKSGREAV